MDEPPLQPTSDEQQQPSTQHAQSPESSQPATPREKGKANNTEDLAADLFPGNFERGYGSLNGALINAIAAPGGPDYATASHLVRELQARINGGHLVAAIKQPLPLAERQRLLNWLWEHGGEDVGIDKQVDGWNTLLLKAVHTNDTELVRWMLEEKGANPNLGPFISVAVGMWGADDLVPDSGSVLAAAVKWSTTPIVELLVQHGAVLANACVVHCAVERGERDMLEKVLDLGGDVEEKETFAIFGFKYVGTPLVRAVKQGDVEFVRLLLQRGASVWGRECVNKKLKEEGKVVERNVIEMVRDSGVSDEVRKLVIDAWAQVE
jgi:hypothetical protein